VKFRAHDKTLLSSMPADTGIKKKKPPTLHAGGLSAVENK
jgi:hypothetical protein